MAGASAMKNMLSKNRLNTGSENNLEMMSLNMVMREDSSAAPDYQSLSPSRGFDSNRALVNNLHDSVHQHA
jgi:hypothetical protein